MKTKILPHTKWGLMALLGVCAVLLLPLANGQETEETEIEELDQFEVSAEAYKGYVGSVTVSGARTTMNLVNVPQTINIITRDLIDDSGADTPLDAMIKMSPGVSSLNGSGLGVNANIRGFRAQNWSVDGATTRYRSGLTNFNYDAFEVIKGPSTLLFGPFGAYGGYINMVAKNARRDPTNRIQASIGTDSHVSGMIDYGGTFGADGNTQYRLVFAALTEDEAGIEHDYKNGWTAAPSVAFDLNDRTRLKIRYQYEELKTKNGNTFLDANGNVVEGFSNQGPNDTYYRMGKTSTYQVILNSEFSDQWAFRMNVMGQFEDYRYGFMLSAGGAPADQYQSWLDYREANQWTIYADASVVWTLDDLPNGLSNRFVAGLEYNFWDLTRWYFARSQNYAEYGRQPINPSNPNWEQFPDANMTDLDYSNRDLPYNRQMPSAALFQETFGMMDDRLLFTLGGRWNYESRESWNRTRRPNTRDGEIEVRDQDPDDFPSYQVDVVQIWTWRYGAVYKPLPNASIYYGHTEAFLPVGGAIQAFDGTPFKNETGQNDELGVKFDLLQVPGGNLSGSLSIFKIEVENKWRGDPFNPGFFLQDGLQENSGYEAQLTYTNEKLSLIAGYYKTNGPIEPSNNNLRGVNVPDRTINFWGKYNVTDNIAIGGGYRSQGDMINGQRNMILPGYDSYDVFASYSRPWGDGLLKFHFTINNVEDEQNILRMNNPANVEVTPGMRAKLTTSFTW